MLYNLAPKLVVQINYNSYLITIIVIITIIIVIVRYMLDVIKLKPKRNRGIGIVYYR